MRLWIVLFILFTSTLHAQYKDGIVVIQYTADFVKAAEVNLDKLEGADQIRLYLTDHPKLFKKNNIVTYQQLSCIIIEKLLYELKVILHCNYLKIH